MPNTASARRPKPKRRSRHTVLRILSGLCALVAVVGVVAPGAARTVAGVAVCAGDCVGDAVVRRRGGAGAAVRADFAPLDCGVGGCGLHRSGGLVAVSVFCAAGPIAGGGYRRGGRRTGEYGRPVCPCDDGECVQGQADPQAIVDAVRDQRVEVLALQETTDEFVAALNDAGIGTYLPYAQVSSSDGVYGNGLWSVTALADPADDDVHSSASFMPGGTVTLGDVPVRFVSVHTTAPVPGYWEQWRRSLDELAMLRADTGTKYIFMGDFNATTDHTPFRNFLGDRFRTRSSSPATGSRHLADRPRMAAALRGHRPYCGRSGHDHRPMRGGGDSRLRPRRPAGHRGRLLIDAVGLRRRMSSARR